MKNMIDYILRIIISLLCFRMIMLTLTQVWWLWLKCPHLHPVSVFFSEPLFCLLVYHYLCCFELKVEMKLGNFESINEFKSSLLFLKGCCRIKLQYRKTSYDRKLLTHMCINTSLFLKIWFPYRSVMETNLGKIVIFLVQFILKQFQVRKVGELRYSQERRKVCLRLNTLIFYYFGVFVSLKRSCNESLS